MGSLVQDNQNKKTFIASNIVLLGMVSFFTDISTEMVYPILPLYLTSIMGASPTIIGIIEGIAESLASIIKLFSGIFADRYGNKKRIAFFGYASSVVNKIIILLSAAWTGVLCARIIDRFGKGIRTAPRDALIAESAHKSELGRAFGLHKGFDLLGTALGIFLAYIILSKNAGDYKKIFLYSLIPALCGIICILFVKDSKEKSLKKAVSFNWKTLDKRLRLFLIFIFIFTLGNSSNAFILLRAYNAGFTAQNAILLYFLYNLTASILSYPFGRLSDGIGRKNILCTGYFLYGIVYFGIGLFSNKTAFVILFIIYGFYTALITGAERALIVETVPEAQKASALGLYAAITGFGLLPASIIAGILWDLTGETVPFIFGGSLAFITSAAVYIIFANKKQQAGTRRFA
ncbi:MAG: MFS transporter [Spirochaetaceae bacterium]|jgi:MFS family permease|nr:MFS transporter [Spirochaetaceae bacterium]